MSNDLNSRSQKERELFLQALEVANLEERRAFVLRSCEGQEELRAAVESLLSNHQEDTFLQTPASGDVATAQAHRGPTGTAVIPEVASMIGSRIGRYKVLQEIGEGGCGTVYMAEQEEPVRRRVALKLIKLGMDTKAVIARFEAERQALALMDHPNIARVLDAGSTETGRPFFVMELVRGVKITEYCDNHQLSNHERLQLFVQVCHAIQHAHQKGIIHRDIKPSNILVTLHDSVPVPKVIDFGVAKATDQRLTDKTVFTAFHTFIGTPAYTSPEQAEMSGLDIDTRSDIYSLGVLLYEMLTGRTPFDGRELMESGLDAMRRTIREQEPMRPSTRLRNLHVGELTTAARVRRCEPAKLSTSIEGDLDWIVMRALEKDRARRYETANAFAMDVQRYLQNEPVLARPPSRLYRFEKFVRRNKVGFAVASAFVICGLLAMTLLAWQYVDKSHAYRRVVQAELEQRLLRQEAQKAQAVESELRRHAQEQALVARRRAYAADMTLAQHALGVNNLGNAKALLARHLPRSNVLSSQFPLQPGPAVLQERAQSAAQNATSIPNDLRGWEWRYLWQQCQSDALFTLCQRSNEVSVVTTSSDGRWVALGQPDEGGVSVYDMRARREVAHFGGRGGRVVVAFSPASSVLAFNSEVPGQPGPPGPPGPPFGGPHARVRIQFWNPETQKIIGEIPLEGGVRGLFFSKDGARLLVVSGNGTSGSAKVSVWSFPDLSLSYEFTLQGMPRFNSIVKASADLEWIAHSMAEGKLRLVDGRTGQEKWTITAADETVTALAFSPDQTTLASGGGMVESDIHLWSLEDGHELGRLEGHRSWVSSLVFKADGKTLISGSGDQTIRSWDLSTHRSLLTLHGHKLEVWCLALMPDQNTLVSGSKDGAVCVWEMNTQRQERSHFVLPALLRAWRFSSDGKSIISLDNQGQLVRWQGDRYQDKQVLLEFNSKVYSAMISPDTRFALVGTSNRIMQLYDTKERKIIADSLLTHRWGFPVGFEPRANHLIVYDPGANQFRELDLVAQKEVRSWDMPQESGHRVVSTISPDGRALLAVDEEGTAQLWSGEDSHRTEFSLGLKQVTQSAFSPDGSLFCSVSRLGIGGVWESGSMKELFPIQGFLQGAHSAAFSPDGKRLAVGSNGKEAVKLWDMDCHQEVLTLAGEGSLFVSTSFSPSGDAIAASNSQGSLHIWQVPTFEQIEHLEAQDR